MDLALRLVIITKGDRNRPALVILVVDSAAEADDGVCRLAVCAFGDDPRLVDCDFSEEALAFPQAKLLHVSGEDFSDRFERLGVQARLHVRYVLAPVALRRAHVRPANVAFEDVVRLRAAQSPKEAVDAVSRLRVLGSLRGVAIFVAVLRVPDEVFDEVERRRFVLEAAPVVALVQVAHEGREVPCLL